MKKHSFKTVQLIAATLFFLLITDSAFAQKARKTKFNGANAAFHKGSNCLGIGLGAGISYNYYGTINTLPAFFVSFDHGIINDAGPGNIGIGGIMAVKAATYKYANGGYKSVWRNYMIGARGTWHLTVLAHKNNKFDPYAGVTAGLRISTHDDTYYNLNPGLYAYDNNSAVPFAGAFIGAKYNFARAVGVFAEAGYDISLFRAGLCFNF